MITKKIAIVLLSSILLGGCTLTDAFRSGDAAKDVRPEESRSSATPQASSDTGLTSMPSTSTSNDISSLEADINSTTILEEDFSNLD